MGVDCVLIITKRSDSTDPARCGARRGGQERGGEGRGEEGGERLFGCGSFGGIQKMLFSDGLACSEKTLNKPNVAMCAPSRIYS